MGAAAATPDIVAALAQLLFDPEESVRIEAIRALKDLGAAAVPRALAVLVPLLRDPDAFRWSAYTLSRLGPAAATPEVLTALAGLLRDCDESVRSTAAEAVGELGPAAATDEVLTALVPLLHQPTKPMRYVGESGTMPGVLAVYHLGAAAATRDVLTALTQRLFDDVASGRSWAAMAVGRLGKSAATREVLAALVQLLHDPVTDVRSSAAWALGALGAPAAKPEVLTALIQLLRDPEIFVWAKAADALSSLLERATPEVLDALIEQVLDALIELGRSDDAAKQATAIRTLHNLGAVISFAPAQSKVLTALLRLRRNAATWEWSRAVGALGVLGAATRPEALDTLVQSLRDPSSTVRSKAAEAIDTIMHQEVRLFLRGRWFFPTQVTPRSLGELAER